MKRTIVVISAAVLLMLSAVILFFSAKSNGAEDVSESRRSTKPIIIIDAGHGGIDGGAVGITGSIEKDINLEIALKLRNKFRLLGYKVVMTRDTDISIHDADAATVRQKKASDLKNRLELTKLYPDSILISIHQNIYNSPSVRGAQVFYSPNNESSKILAEYLQTALNSQMKAGKPRSVKAAGDKLYLFYNAQNTAVLVECGFISNAEEEKLLCSDSYQEMLSNTICKTVLTYLKEV